MKERIQALADRFESFSVRERALISLAVFAVLFLLWDTFLMSPEEMHQKQMIGKMHSTNNKIAQLSTDLNTMTEVKRGGDDSQVRARIEEVKRLLASLEKQEQEMTVEFIRPQQMAGVLKDMLASEGKLVLRSLESLGASPLFPPEPNQGQAQGNLPRATSPTVYKHGMRVVFEGDYFSTKDFLHSLESMPWRFFWDNVEYQVIKYPRARVTITIHTLSLETGWIGV